MKTGAPDNAYRYNGKELDAATADMIMGQKGIDFLEGVRSQPGTSSHHRRYICFLEGTLVKTSDNRFTPIEQLSVGDPVITFNFILDDIESKPIVQTFHSEADKYIKLTIWDIKSGQEIKILVTEEHPFYTNNPQKWVPANQLKPDLELFNISDQVMTVKSLEFIDSKVSIFNIEVPGNHNYFVTIKSILVHNLSF